MENINKIQKRPLNIFEKVKIGEELNELRHNSNAKVPKLDIKMPAKRSTRLKSEVFVCSIRQNSLDNDLYDLFNEDFEDNKLDNTPSKISKSLNFVDGFGRYCSDQSVMYSKEQHITEELHTIKSEKHKSAVENKTTISKPLKKVTKKQLTKSPHFAMKAEENKSFNFFEKARIKVVDQSINSSIENIENKTSALKKDDLNVDCKLIRKKRAIIPKKYHNPVIGLHANKNTEFGSENDHINHIKVKGGILKIKKEASVYKGLVLLKRKKRRKTKINIPQSMPCNSASNICYDKHNVISITSGSYLSANLQEPIENVVSEIFKESPSNIGGPTVCKIKLGNGTESVEFRDTNLEYIASSNRIETIAISNLENQTGPDNMYPKTRLIERIKNNNEISTVDENNYSTVNNKKSIKKDKQPSLLKKRQAKNHVENLDPHFSKELQKTIENKKSESLKFFLEKSPRLQESKLTISNTTLTRKDFNETNAADNIEAPNRMNTKLTNCEAKQIETSDCRKEKDIVQTTSKTTLKNDISILNAKKMGDKFHSMETNRDISTENPSTNLLKVNINNEINVELKKKQATQENDVSTLEGMKNIDKFNRVEMNRAESVNETNAQLRKTEIVQEVKQSAKSICKAEDDDAPDNRNYTRKRGRRPMILKKTLYNIVSTLKEMESTEKCNAIKSNGNNTVLESVTKAINDKIENSTESASTTLIMINNTNIDLQKPQIVEKTKRKRGGLRSDKSTCKEILENNDSTLEGMENIDKFNRVEINRTETDNETNGELRETENIQEVKQSAKSMCKAKDGDAPDNRNSTKKRGRRPTIFKETLDTFVSTIEEKNGDNQILKSVTYNDKSEISTEDTSTNLIMVNNTNNELQEIQINEKPKRKRGRPRSDKSICKEALHNDLSALKGKECLEKFDTSGKNKDNQVPKSVTKVSKNKSEISKENVNTTMMVNNASNDTITELKENQVSQEPKRKRGKPLSTPSLLKENEVEDRNSSKKRGRRPTICKNTLENDFSNLEVIQNLDKSDTVEINKDNQDLKSLTNASNDKSEILKIVNDKNNEANADLREKPTTQEPKRKRGRPRSNKSICKKTLQDGIVALEKMKSIDNHSTLKTNRKKDLGENVAKVLKDSNAILRQNANTTVMMVNNTNNKATSELRKKQELKGKKGNTTKLAKKGLNSINIRRIPQDRLDEVLDMLGDEDHPIWNDRNVSCNAGIHHYWETRTMISEHNMKMKYARQFLLRRDWLSLAKILCMSKHDTKNSIYYPLLVKYATLCLAHTDKEQFNKFVKSLTNTDDENVVIKKCTQISRKNEECEMPRTEMHISRTRTNVN